MLLRVVLAVLLLVPARVCVDPELEQGIDRLAAKHRVLAGTPGVAVAILEPGEAPVHMTYGPANLGLRTRIATSTTFELASLCKPFTALVILMLCDRGLLSLNDSVRKHIPELPVYQKDQPLRVRVRAGDQFLWPVILGVLVWAGLYLGDSRLRVSLPLQSELVVATVL